MLKSNQENLNAAEGDFTSHQFFGALGAGAAAGIAVLAATALYAESDWGIIQSPAKAYMAEVVVGAGAGMRDLGWSDEGLEQRLHTIKAEITDFAGDAFSEAYRLGFDQGASGEWSESALEAYIEVIEAPMWKTTHKYLDADISARSTVSDWESGSFFSHRAGVGLAVAHHAIETHGLEGFTATVRGPHLMRQSPRDLTVAVFGEAPEDAFIAQAEPYEYEAMSMGS